MPALKRARVLSGLSDRQLRTISARFSPRSYPRDAFLLKEGEPATTYFLIASGQVKILQTSVEGVDVILHVLGPGELIGALPTLGKGTYPASGQAMSDVTAHAILAADFEMILEEYPQVTLNLLRFATGVIQRIHKQLREMATERVERRIARTLSRLAGRLGVRNEQGILLNAPISRQDLAEMTGTTLFTVSRTLKGWERDGLIRSAREQITILDPHALVSIGEDIPSDSASS